MFVNTEKPTEAVPDACCTLQAVLKRRLFLISIAIIGLCLSATAQLKPSIDRVVGVVGDHVILQSDINQMYMEIASQDPAVSDTIVCTIMQNLLTRDLLCEQAERDSVTVSEEEVEGTLDNRVRYFVQQYGSEERMQATIGKSVSQVKDEYRRLFKDQLLSTRMQSQVVSNVKVSPTEVRAFFEKIPKDSLPMYPSMVEVGQIVFTPVANKEVEDYSRQQLEDAREQIISGKMDFETAATLISQDGSASNGGDLGIVSRDEMVPEFTSAAFRLQNGEISNVVKTRFGFHIIQMVQRLGEKARLRHILVKPVITSVDIAATKAKADSVLQLINSKKITFVDGVAKFSTDEATKNTGGMFTNQATGTSLVNVDELEPDVALQIGKMQPGEYSAPQTYKDPRTGDVLVRIVYLKNLTEPHIANLATDYSRIQEAALSEKQNRVLQEWTAERIAQFYIYVHPDYILCESLTPWVKASSR
ncbi:MAG: hypothetical protein RL660_1561 [Bacteroidota bacterium]|jgi:peptidyl-prolyl cis-trans isomerase SurA